MDTEAIPQVLKITFIYIFFSGSNPNLTFYVWGSWVKFKTLIEAWSQILLQDYHKALKKIIKGLIGKDRN